jgi:hypothetical protein
MNDSRATFRAVADTPNENLNDCNNQNNNSIWQCGGGGGGSASISRNENQFHFGSSPFVWFQHCFRNGPSCCISSSKHNTHMNMKSNDNTTALSSQDTTSASITTTMNDTNLDDLQDSDEFLDADSTTNEGNDTNMVQQTTTSSTTTASTTTASTTTMTKKWLSPQQYTMEVWNAIVTVMCLNVFVQFFTKPKKEK